ncbi:hypothetical protein WJX72_010428 [[Myrmecia] bisecta]|uniref:Uncharacterized protein n=1 Tax=[Myrmecia] bisecta TaxID=41462 RepID=A0AAW1PTV7_9CHLO
MLLRSLAFSASAGLSLGLACSVPLAHAEPGKTVKVGEFSSGGLVFKDTVEVQAFQDPKVQGITVYVSNVKRPLVDRLKKDLFTDPSQSSVSCVQTGLLRVLEPVDRSSEGEEVFSTRRNLFFKYMHVRRIYDQSNQALVYIAYSSRLTQDMSEQNSRYRTSISAVSLLGQKVSGLNVQE